MTKIAIGILALVVVGWLYPTIRYHLRDRKWRKLPGHNPWKPGDSE